MINDPSKEEMVKALMESPCYSEVDLLDVEAAIYWFASDYHGGQTSNLYSTLSTSNYVPSPLINSIDDEPEIIQFLYDELLDKFME